MNLKQDQHYAAGETSYYSHIFGTAFLQLDHIRHEHDAMLSSDHMMSNKLEFLTDVLKRFTADDEPVPPSVAELMAVQIMKSSRYAKDMAEEEQRIVAESHDGAAGNEEAEAAEYFVLSDQLNQCATTLRRNISRLNQP